MHYNSLFTNTFESLGFNVVYQPSCLQLPYNQHCWPIKFPKVDWTDNTIVIMHCQDFISIRNNRSPELEAIEKHFNNYANRIVVIHWNIDLTAVYNGRMHLIHFPTHSYELLNNLHINVDDWNSKLQKSRQYVWQSLNGLPRPHRRLVAKKLSTYNNGILSLSTEIPLPEFNYQTYFGCENEINWIRLLPVYSNCSINVVTETQYTECPGIISEKTLMAFLALQIPIVIGYKGIIDHCRRLGFDMFDDVVDTTFDLLEDHVRWEQALDLNQSLLKNGIDRDKFKERLKYNQQHALTWPSRMIELFKQDAALVKR